MPSESTQTAVREAAWGGGGVELFDLNALREEEWVSARGRVKKESVLNRGHSVSAGRLARELLPCPEDRGMVSSLVLGKVESLFGSKMLRALML